MSEKYKRVNWVDGQSVNKDHFIGSENALIQQIAVNNLIAVNGVNYGLIAQPGGEDAIVFSPDISIEANTVKVSLVSCQAITRGGYMINITKEIAKILAEKNAPLILSEQFKQEDEPCYLLLSVNPFKRMEFGEFNTEEEPPRIPYVIPEYKISLAKNANMQGTDKQSTNLQFDYDIAENSIKHNYIPIGKILFKNGNPTVDETYIPPCASILSHSTLNEKFKSIASKLKEVEKNCRVIVLKNNQSTGDFEKDFSRLAEKLMYQISTVLPNINICQKHTPPVIFITQMMGLAKLLYNNLETSLNKDELYYKLHKYFDAIKNRKDFDQMLNKIFNINYQHENIYEAINTVDVFVDIVGNLFSKMAEKNPPYKIETNIKYVEPNILREDFEIEIKKAEIEKTKTENEDSGFKW